MSKQLYNADLRTIQAALNLRKMNLEDMGRTEAAKCVQETLHRILQLNVGDIVEIKSLAD